MPAPAPPLLAGPGGLRPYVWRLVSTGGIVLAGMLLYAFTPLTGEWSWVGAVVALASIAVIAPLTVRRVRAVATSEEPVLEAVQAIVLLLTVLIFGFAGLFVVLDQRPDQFVGLETKLDAVYFTVTTLSTVGYGDVHAAGQAARGAVTVQIIFDLAFLAVALRLVVGAARHRVTERLGTGGPLVPGPGPGPGPSTTPGGPAPRPPAP